MSSRTAKRDSVESSSVFADTYAKMKAAIDDEVATRLRLGQPVIVDEGRGIEDLSQQTVSSD